MPPGFVLPWEVVHRQSCSRLNSMKDLAMEN
jgi:hypothetical protein